MTIPRLPGAYTPLTAFLIEGEPLDRAALRQPLARLANNISRYTGFALQGSNGQVRHLSHEERILVPGR